MSRPLWNIAVLSWRKHLLLSREFNFLRSLPGQHQSLKYSGTGKVHRLSERLLADQMSGQRFGEKGLRLYPSWTSHS